MGDVSVHTTVDVVCHSTDLPERVERIAEILSADGWEILGYSCGATPAGLRSHPVRWSLRFRPGLGAETAVRQATLKAEAEKAK